MQRRVPSTIPMLIGVDKPAGMTSHDVVGRVRRAVGERRVGHAGTLDPLATGVMVVGIGQATRLMAYATAEEKSYVARFVFGRETTTDDLEGETRVELGAPGHALNVEWARAQMGLLLQMTSQVPPSYSAVQVDGVRAYDAARRGSELELAARPIEVLGALLLSVGTVEEGPDCGLPWWDVALRVSKGTYVRGLARDLGRSLGSACYVRELRRTASGPVTLGACMALDALEEGGAEGLKALDPVRATSCQPLRLGSADVEDVRNGKRLSAARTDGGVALSFGEGARVALVRDGLMYGVAERQGGAVVPKAVFADGIAGVACSL